MPTTATTMTTAQHRGIVAVQLAGGPTLIVARDGHMEGSALADLIAGLGLPTDLSALDWDYAEEGGLVFWCVQPAEAAALSRLPEQDDPWFDPLDRT